MKCISHRQNQLSNTTGAIGLFGHANCEYTLHHAEILTATLGGVAVYAVFVGLETLHRFDNPWSRQRNPDIRHGTLRALNFWMAHPDLIKCKRRKNSLVLANRNNAGTFRRPLDSLGLDLEHSILNENAAC